MLHPDQTTKLMRALKAPVRAGLKVILPSRQPATLVASMGRSGSTLVYNSIVKGVATKRFGARGPALSGVVRDVAWDLSDRAFRRGRVYKTHDLPAGLSAGSSPKAVFLFGRASDAVRSLYRCETVYGPDWIKAHFRHLSAQGCLAEIAEKDILQFSAQLDDWLSFEGVPVLALRYESLWSSGAEALLSTYIGVPVKLPARKARQSANLNLGETEAQICATYKALDARTANLPDIIANTKARALLGMADV